MSKARLIITAVVLEGRSQADVASAYGVSQAWVSRLLARYRAEGDAALELRSRRPRTRPDAGADTIMWHLEHHHHINLSRATIYRIVRRATGPPRTA